jgi:peptidoglycan-associated lipoprotein
MKKQRGLMCALMGLALVVAGCAGTTTTTKDDASSPVAASLAGGATRPASTAKDMSPIAVAGTSSANSQKAAAGLKTVAFEAIYFGFDAATISTDARSVLSRTAQQLIGSNGSQGLKIEGHCDERGSAEYNMALGEKRALAAKNYLVTLGVGAERLSVISYGKERPAEAGHDEQAWAKNRRDEFKFN